MNDMWMAGVKTEAELQAHLVATLRKALPALPAEIRLERHLNLKLGHQTIVLDGWKPTGDVASGRYDFLVLVRNIPVLLVELKAPNVPVGPDDIGQALSYANAHRPRVPLVAVSNGAVTVVKRTCDEAEVSAGDLEESRLSTVLAGAMAVAASATEDAIRTLLGSSRETWTELFAGWSKEEVAALSGTLDELGRPISERFAIPRTAAKQVQDALAGGARVVVLHGPPLSGITNTLAQVAQSGVGPMLFVDGRAANDVLQSIANRLTRQLSFAVSKDDLRGWLNTRKGLADLTIVVDGIPREGCDELIEAASAGLLRLVLGLDSATYSKHSAVCGRSQETPLGREAVPVELLPLSDEEFDKAQDLLFESFGACFCHGAQYVPDLRWPGTLRVVTASLPESAGDKDLSGRRTCLLLPSILGAASLGACSRVFGSDAELMFDLQELARAFLADAAAQEKDLDWLVETWGRPSVDPGVAEGILGEQRIARLQRAGIVSWIVTRILGPRVLIRAEELLGHHVADVWAGGLTNLTEPDAIADELGRLLTLSGRIPAGEVPLAAAILRASFRNSTIASVAVPYLMEQEPTTSRLVEGAHVELLTRERRPIRLHFGKGMDEEVVGNLQPWLVLSHLAFLPIVSGGDAGTENAVIFAKLGSSRHFIYRPRPTELARVPGLHFHDIPGIGSLPCLKTGIVEPLLQAMLDHARSVPTEFAALAQLAMDERRVHLAWRILAVAQVAQTSTDADVEETAKLVIKILEPWWGDAIGRAVGLHVSSGGGKTVPRRRREKKKRHKR